MADILPPPTIQKKETQVQFYDRLEDYKTNMLSTRYSLLIKIMNELFSTKNKSMSDFNKITIDQMKTNADKINVLFKYYFDIKNTFAVTLQLTKNVDNESYVKHILAKLLCMAGFHLRKLKDIYHVTQ